MKTDQLIAILSDDLRPAPRGAVMRTLLLGLAAGVLISAAVMIMTIHPRRDLALVMHTWPFWMRFSYTAILACIALALVDRQARAGANARAAFVALGVPVVALIVLAAVQLSAPDADVAHLVMGRTWTVCPWLIVALAVPLYFPIALAMRRLAPTSLGLAGGAAGLLAGAGAATIYGFHCHEMAAPFILIWYTLGILVSAGLGAALGPKILHW